MINRLLHNPIAVKRFLRFKEMKRAYLSFWLLFVLYLLSWCSELLCNSDPLYMHFNGQTYFPALVFYPEDTFLQNGKGTRPDYKKIQQNPLFHINSGNFMVFAPIPYGPYESIDPESIAVANQVQLQFTPQLRVASINITPDFSIARSNAAGNIFGTSDQELRGRSLTDYFQLTDRVREAIASRFKNMPSPAIQQIVELKSDQTYTLSLSQYPPRTRPPRSVRLTLREKARAPSTANRITFHQDLAPVSKSLTQDSQKLWEQLDASEQALLLSLVERRFTEPVAAYHTQIDGQLYKVDFIKQDVRFPYPPVEGHWLGIDGAGRDVLARILYGLRTSLSFGLLLVTFSMLLGIIIGAFQGYYGGVLDITSQRLIEIWSALPFLYIMILMGSVYGRSFALLLFCYGIFNWIGISYYMRAEFLRLRKQPFVEAAECMGVSTRKIIFKHILPNGLVPVITFFPFSLVGAIGSLAALDYLGFGLPPPTPSWGELLFQAQQYRWAWWLILYPSLALFVVMLLGVFIGEGIRNAYDPKRYTRLD
jgi:microcin C transport system permease protein